MAATKKSKKLTLRPEKFRISKDVKDYDDDPFLVKKAEEAQAFLKKIGLPSELMNK